MRLRRMRRCFKMYAVKNIKDGNYLNYASKRKKWLSKGWVGRTIQSPFPTLRPKDHIEKHFKKWIANTCHPQDYVIVEFKETTPKPEEDGE